MSRRCSQAIFSRSWPFRRDDRVGLVDGTVEGRRPVAHSAILHPLLQLLVLELGGIKGCRVVHEGIRVEHIGAGIGVEMVEASAIVVLDGGVVHPGAHVCGKWLRRPICNGDLMLAMEAEGDAPVGRFSGPVEMAKRDSRTRRDDSATWMPLRSGGRPCPPPSSTSTTCDNAHRGHLQDVTRHREGMRGDGMEGWFVPSFPLAVLIDVERQETTRVRFERPLWV